MLIGVSLDNFEKKFDHIIEIIEYERDEFSYIIKKWRDIIGSFDNYRKEKRDLVFMLNAVREDKRLIKSLFESLVITDIWTWK